MASRGCAGTVRPSGTARRLAAAALMVLMVAACGQRGPLTLPKPTESAPPSPRPPASAPAEESSRAR